MEENKYKAGEIVQLKSGGPKMTVEEYITSGRVRCQWFAGSKLANGIFSEESLMKPPPDAKEKK